LRVLAELERCRARGTFFVLGERVQATPEVVRAAVDAGHEVQLHGHRHLRHSQLEEEQIELDTRTALGALAQVGVHPTRWRTPWGIVTPASERVAARHGLTLVHWTIDTHDWRGDPALAMLARARRQLARGAVVLMHDGLGPGAMRGGCENTVELLAPLIAAARARGLAPAAAVPASSDGSARGAEAARSRSLEHGALQPLGVAQ
jgi:peptidoglycan/xylan/chitin deacetylase (PgdA/CDA1 family)